MCEPTYFNNLAKYFQRKSLLTAQVSKINGETSDSVLTKKRVYYKPIIMRIVVFGAAGFIGTNLLLALAKDKRNQIVAIDEKNTYFRQDVLASFSNIQTTALPFSKGTDFEALLEDGDLVFHLVSTTVPAQSNERILEDIVLNVEPTIRLLEACSKKKGIKILFISSGGTVYGDNPSCPIKETAPTDPISSYGIQKLTIEKLLELFHHIYGLDYVIARLSNPYGPYQRPDGRLGVICTFAYHALKGEPLIVYGNGEIIRDFIYIDDVIVRLLTLAFHRTKYRIYNIGSNKGTSINQIIKMIAETTGKNLKVTRAPSRNADVPANYLDTSRYESEFPGQKALSLEKGIKKTVEFFLNCDHL